MNISDALYTYGIKDRKCDRILKRISKGKRVHNLYVIVLPLMHDGLLEIYVYNQLLQPLYRSVGDQIHVLGIAMNKGDAEELVLQMVQDMYDAGDGKSLDTDFFIREA